MSQHDRRRDPRAEPDEHVDTTQVERPFQRIVPTLALESAAPAPSDSQVRAIATPLPRIIEASAPVEPIEPGDAAMPSLPVGPAPSAGVAEDLQAPSLTAVEHLLDQGEWHALSELLGPAEKAAALPPHLALVYALARSESSPDDAGQTIDFAIRSAARAHGLSETSPITRIIAKRLLRKAPTNWRSRPAPPKKISALIVLIALTLGGGTGFWLSTTQVRIPLPGFLVR